MFSMRSTALGIMLIAGFTSNVHATPIFITVKIQGVPFRNLTADLFSIADVEFGIRSDSEDYSDPGAGNGDPYAYIPMTVVSSNQFGLSNTPLGSSNSFFLTTNSYDPSWVDSFRIYNAGTQNTPYKYDGGIWGAREIPGLDAWDYASDFGPAITDLASNSTNLTFEVNGQLFQILGTADSVSFEARVIPETSSILMSSLPLIGAVLIIGRRRFRSVA